MAAQSKRQIHEHIRIAAAVLVTKFETNLIQRGRRFRKFGIG